MNRVRGKSGILGLALALGQPCVWAMAGCTDKEASRQIASGIEAGTEAETEAGIRSGIEAGIDARWVRNDRADPPDTGPDGDDTPEDAPTPPSAPAGSGGEPAPPVERSLVLLPRDNPAGGPVLIRGEQLDRTQQVRFGAREADFIIVSEGELITHVPGALLPGNVQVEVVADDGQMGVADFAVLADYPPGPPSPGDIERSEGPGAGFIPPISDQWLPEGSNGAATYRYQFLALVDCGAGSFAESFEVVDDDFDNRHPITGTFDVASGAVQLVVQRPEGAESYQGRIAGDEAQPRMVLFSESSGRQLVLATSAWRCTPQPICEGDSTSICSCGDRPLCCPSFLIAEPGADPLCVTTVMERCASCD